MVLVITEPYKNVRVETLVGEFDVVDVSRPGDDDLPGSEYEEDEFHASEDQSGDEVRSERYVGTVGLCYVL